MNLAEADLDHWPDALETLAALAPAAVGPGHGARFDPAMLRESIDIVRALRPASTAPAGAP